MELLMTINYNTKKIFVNGKDITNTIFTPVDNSKKYALFVKYNGNALKYVPPCYQSKEMCIDAVNQDVNNIHFIHHDKYDIFLELVKINGLLLEHVKNQSLELCLEAVKNNGMALKYVIDQTPEICLCAVKNNGLALEFVKKQSLVIINEACKQNKEAYKYKYHYIF